MCPSAVCLLAMIGRQLSEYDIDEGTTSGERTTTSSLCKFKGLEANMGEEKTTATLTGPKHEAIYTNEQ